MAARALTEQVKVGLAVGAVLMTLLGFVLARLRQRARENEPAREYMKRSPLIHVGPLRLNVYQTFWASLVVFALFGTINYNRYNTNLIVEGWDEYDLLHYYITPKYFDELGYFRLLPALIIADKEVGEYCPGQAPIYLAQDENDYFMRPIRHAYAREEEIKSRFTPERWEEFVHDSMFVQRSTKRLKCFLWRQLLQDHGFNGTPAWVFVARPIVSMIPVEYIKGATILDLVLIIGMLAAIAWAFGPQTAAFAWIFITVCYSFRWPTITWVMFRYDWLTTLVIGICMLRKEKWYAAGAFFAYAALMRYFPVLWLFPIVVRGGWGLVAWVIAFVRKRPRPPGVVGIPVRYLKMLAAFVAVVALLWGGSLARDGVETTRQSLHNMAAHTDPKNLSSMRQGLQIALTYRGETDQKLISRDKKEMVEELETPVRVVGLVAMLAMCLLTLKRRSWEPVGLMMMPYFWLTTSSYYYYSLRLTAIVVHAADLSKMRNVVGLAMLFALEAFCNGAEHLMSGYRYFLISWMGIALTAYSVVMLGFLAHEWWGDRQEAKAAIGAPEPSRDVGGDAPADDGGKDKDGGAA